MIHRRTFDIPSDATLQAHGEKVALATRDAIVEHILERAGWWHTTEGRDALRILARDLSDWQLRVYPEDDDDA